MVAEKCFCVLFFKIQNWLLTSKVASKLKALEKGGFGKEFTKMKMMKNLMECNTPATINLFSKASYA